MAIPNALGRYFRPSIRNRFFDLYIAGYSIVMVCVEFVAIAAMVGGGTLLMGGAGFVGGTLIGIFVQGLILTYITFDGMLPAVVNEDIDRL